MGSQEIERMPAPDVAATTLRGALQASVERYGSKEFLRYHDGTSFVGMSYAEFAARSDRLGAAFLRMGLEAGDCVAILAENGPEWALADYAIMSAGLVSVPLYSTLPHQQIAYILHDSKSRAIVLSTRQQAEKIAAIGSDCPDLIHSIAVEADAIDALPGARLFEDLVAEEADMDALNARREAIGADDVVTLIYTSGTTGKPKGVELTHDNFLSNVRSSLKVLNVGPDDLFLSFLPLSHAFERMAGHFLPAAVGASIGYSRGLRYVGQDLREVAPTLMSCVPRFYENLHERVLKAAESGSPLKRRIFHWSFAMSRARGQRIRDDRRVGVGLRVANVVAERLVFSKLHANIGGRLRFFLSGAAPLAQSTAEFFHAAGILILEGYGLTETSPVISVNHERQYRFGTVGPPIPDIEVRIADDGEILTRGRHVMRGYYHLPEETKEVIDEDGWFHTGDLGDLTDGFLRITGRKKSLFKLSSGKYIAPEPVENVLKASPYIQESVVIGESRKVAGAIIVPAFDALADVVGDEELDVSDREALVSSPAVRKLIRQEVDRHTAHLADFEKLRVLIVVPKEFTIESGELTPTLKVKRAEVLARMSDRIDAAYAASD